MGKLSEFRSSYYTFTEKARDTSRSLALAGIGVIWILRVENGVAPPAPMPALLPALAFLCASLGLDAMQYAVQSAVWGIFTRSQEIKLKATEDSDPSVEASPLLNWPGLGLFWLKLACSALGFVLLFRVVLRLWFR